MALTWRHDMFGYSWRTNMLRIAQLRSSEHYFLLQRYLAGFPVCRRPIRYDDLKRLCIPPPEGQFLSYFQLAREVGLNVPLGMGALMAVSVPKEGLRALNWKGRTLRHGCCEGKEQEKAMNGGLMWNDADKGGIGRGVGICYWNGKPKEDLTTRNAGWWREVRFEDMFELWKRAQVGGWGVTGGGGLRLSWKEEQGTDRGVGAWTGCKKRDWASVEELM
ncbi:hypothetical protein KSP40_PGU015664 [Platanthera guangdongensis]|uniref:Uncharacterized protein n=1 Tax=Platanthera guangdongensis TaxID=2320717 RepID=A0ABR2MKG2_9ASPA